VTRKDFELLARFFNYEREISVDDKRREQIVSGLARLLASELAKTNTRFDRERFLTACGVK
jgi:hypothetical protein